MTSLEDILVAVPAPDLRNLAKTLRINMNNMQQPQIIKAVIGHTKQNTIGTMFTGRAGGTERMILKRCVSTI